MADILDYLDSIHIDVVKRKYFNANKVNAVFDEIRTLVTELIAENQKLREAMSEQSAEELKSMEALDSLQKAYRETLASAHSRADELIATASAASSEMTKKAEQRETAAVRLVEECLNAVKVRQEQNVDFINSQLQQFLLALYEENEPESVINENKSSETNCVSEDTRESIQSQVSALSSEIQALELGDHL